MTFECQDEAMLNDWLTVGPITRVANKSETSPYTTRLLGRRVSVWRNSKGGLVAREAGTELMIQEVYGYMWICPSGKPHKHLFKVPEYDQPDRRIVDCEGIGVAVSGLRMVENFIDMGHFPYVHASYLGEVPHTEVVQYDVNVDEPTNEIWATNCEFFQPRASKAATTGLDVKYRYRVTQPLSAILYKTAFTCLGEFDVIGLFVQPHDEENITAYCLLAYYDDVNEDRDLIAFQHTIFGQDKPILENQLPKRMPLRPGAEVPTRCDAMSVAYRRWLTARGTSYGAIV